AVRRLHFAPARSGRACGPVVCVRANGVGVNMRDHVQKADKAGRRGIRARVAVALLAALAAAVPGAAGAGPAGGGGGGGGAAAAPAGGGGGGGPAGGGGSRPL